MTSFAFPEEKIVDRVPPKAKLFARHVVDPEVAAMLPGSSIGHVFSNECDYFADLQSARYSVTTQRSGWDCMRHYEIAANGCVPCFRNLDKKPVSCAPHGLRPGQNCLLYHSAEELLRLTDSISDAEYLKLAEASLAWAHANSTAARAREVLTAWRSFRANSASGGH